MKNYKWKESKKSIVDENGNIVLILSGQTTEEFTSYCGELLVRTLNEEEYWKMKVKLFADQMSERKGTL